MFTDQIEKLKREYTDKYVLVDQSRPELARFRDVVGRVGDLLTDPVAYVDPTRTRNIMWVTRIVNRRAELLDASRILETAALDRYEFVRDAYLQRRRNLIHDGTPPLDKDALEPPERDKPAAEKPRTEAPSQPDSATHAAEPAPPAAAVDPLPVANGRPHHAGPGTPVSNWYSGEAYTPAQLEALEHGHAALPPPQPDASAQPSQFVRLWRSVRSAIQ